MEDRLERAWQWIVDNSGTALAVSAGMAAGALLYHAWRSTEGVEAAAEGDDRLPGWKMPWHKHGVNKSFDMCEYEDRPEFAITRVQVLKTPHLADRFPDRNARVENFSPRLSHLLKADYAIIGDIVRKVGHAPATRAYVRAGPRPTLFFTPKAVRAAIMTVGGLCPGLNNVIRELTRTLISVYEVDAVLGLRDGLWGLHDTAPDEELRLTLERVQDIHKCGGSILGSARGGLSPELLPKAVEAVKRRRLSMLFIIGGDGTHRAANVLSAALRDASVVCSVVCIPKTIDNDIDIIDRSFGFSTAVAEAIKAVEAARTEAQAAPAGIGLVKVMGRNAGFIAAHAALACGVVDVCLIPEVPVVLHGADGIFGHIERTIEAKGYAVVLAAEGAGQDLMREAEAKTPGGAAAAATAAADGGGHSKLLPIAKFLRGTMKAHFAALGKEATIKLIDPSYIVRSVEACATDALYCLLLGQNAVHAAMSGFTEISLGLCNNRMVYLPITSIVANSPRVMDPLGRTWERVVSTTGQPNTAKPLVGQAAHAITGRTIF